MGAVDVDRRRPRLGPYLAQPDAVAQPVEDALTLPDAEVQAIEVLLAQVPRPPQPRLLYVDPEVQLGRSGREHHLTLDASRLSREVGGSQGGGDRLTVQEPRRWC